MESVANGYEKVPLFWSVAQPKAPLDQVRYCPAEQPPRPFTYNREVEAMVVERLVVVALVKRRFVPDMAVVEAYGKMLATVEVEVMVPAMN